jgi:anti-anti-sigma factor
MRITLLDGRRPAPAASLAVSTAWVGRRAVITADGELDRASLWRLRAATDAAVDPASEVWIDLTRLRAMHPAGLHLLLAVRGRMWQPRRRLTVICPDGPVRRAIEEAGLDEVLDLCDTRDEALGLL